MESALEVMKENNCKPFEIYCSHNQAATEYFKGKFKSKGGHIYFEDIKVINYMTGHQFTEQEVKLPERV